MNCPLCPHCNFRPATPQSLPNHANKHVRDGDLIVSVSSGDLHKRKYVYKFAPHILKKSPPRYEDLEQRFYGIIEPMEQASNQPK